MKLEPKLVRYLDNDHYRVLTAVEMGSRNHEVVPTELIMNISQIRNGSIHLINQLARHNLIAKVVNTKYDGYRLTYGGYDYLALKTISRRGVLHSVGNQIGVGKESDIYIVADADGNQYVLKLHRLGRTSFRNIKNTRDYLRNRNTSSWLYLSRLAAKKEFVFMETLYNHGFPVPKPIEVNRHCILMELIDATPLSQVQEVDNPGKLYSDLMNLIVKLAKSGLIHGDFNEFNLLITHGDARPILIDFPQMVSTSHRNAKMYFDRDVACIRTFFLKRFKYQSQLYPIFSKCVPVEEVGGGSETTAGHHEDATERLDKLACASGFTLKNQQELEDVLVLEAEANMEEPEDEDDEEEGDEIDEELPVVLSEQETAELAARLNEELSLVKEEEENEILSASDRVGSDEDGVNSNVLDVVVDGDDDKSDGRDDDSDDKEEDDTESVILPNNHEYRPHRDHMKTPSALASSNSKSAKVYKKLTSSDIKERVANSLKNKGSSAGKKGNGNGASRRNRVKSGTGRAASDAVKYGGIGWD